MRKLTLALMLGAVLFGGCSRRKQALNAPPGSPQAIEDTRRWNERYNNHDPNDTMSINSMGSD